MLDPTVLGQLSRLYGPVFVVAHLLQAVRDPFHVLLDRHDHVGQYRGTTGSCDGEEVGEALDHQAKVGLGAFSPLVLKGHSITTRDVYGREGAGHGIESGGEYYGVEGQRFAFDVDPSFGNGTSGCIRKSPGARWHGCMSCSSRCPDTCASCRSGNW